MSAVRHGRRAWFAWIAVCVIWGTTYLAIKVALATVPPFLVGGFRYESAGLLMAGALALGGHRLPRPSTWPTLAVLGCLMLAVGNGGVVWGEQYLPSGLTAVILATSAFWLVGVDAWLPSGVRPGRRQVVGLVVGFCGVAVLVWPDIRTGGVAARGFVEGLVSLQVACLGWALASGYTRRHVLSDDVLGAAALQMVFGGAVMLLVATGRGEWAQVSFTVQTAAAMAYLSVAGGIVAFACYSYALQHLPMAVVSLYTFVNPVIAVALGILWLGEPFAARQVVASVVILLGMAIVRSR